MELLMWIRLGVAWGCRILKVQLGSGSNMAHSHDWHAGWLPGAQLTVSIKISTHDLSSIVATG